MEQNQKRNHNALLVTIANKRFIDQAKQLFSSVYWNAGWKGDYMLLAHEIPEKDLEWFRDKGILVKKCKLLYPERMKSYSSVLSNKFYVFMPEFKKWKNVIYLDADIIVRGSLNKLAKVKGFWAVKDMNKPELREQYIRKDDGDEISREYNIDYKTFNAGVFAFSTDIITESTIKEMYIIFKKYISISKYADQLILNLFFYKKWKKLPLIYDVFPTFFIKKYDFMPENIGGLILHFVRFDKEKSSRPWDKKNPFYFQWKSNLRKAEKINLDKIPKTKYNISYLKGFFYIKVLYFIGRFFIKNFGDFICHHIYNPIKDLIIFKVIMKFKQLLFKTLGIIGQSIKKVSPSLYYRLKGKNGTKKKS